MSRLKGFDKNWDETYSTLSSILSASLKLFSIKARRFCSDVKFKTIRDAIRGFWRSSSPVSASPTFSDSFIKKFRQKENKNGSLSYFYKDRAPYSADPKKCSHKNKARGFRWKERGVNRHVICIKCTNDCFLRSAGLNSPAGGEKKERKKNRETSYNNHAMLPNHADGNRRAPLQRKSNSSIATQLCRSVQMQHCCNMRLLLIFFFFYLNFLLTRMTASVASTHHANVKKNSMLSWRWKERDRHTLRTLRRRIYDI